MRLKRRYVGGLVSEIVVDREKAVISGPRAAIAATVTSRNFGCKVLTSVRDWRSAQCGHHNAHDPHRGRETSLRDRPQTEVKFPDKQGIYRELYRIWAVWADSVMKNPRYSRRLTYKFPAQMDPGIFAAEQGIIVQEQGINLQDKVFGRGTEQFRTHEQL
jgi:hypothetical protein